MVIKIIKNRREKDWKSSHCNFFIKNRKGWVEIVEVFIAILLLTGILLVVIESTPKQEDEKILKIYEKEASILRDIELNTTLRAEVLNSVPPVEWTGFDSSLPLIKERIISFTPPDLECQAKICGMVDSCVIGEFVKKNVYVSSVVISANLNTYSPKQLKLYCINK